MIRIFDESKLLRTNSQVQTLLYCALESSSSSEVQSLIEMAIEKSESVNSIIENKPEPHQQPRTPSVETISTVNTLAERLSRAMSLRDIGQGELARKVGMSQPAIFKLVNGETKTSRKIVEIALVLEVNPAWLQCGEGEMTDFCASKKEEL
ncbi:helix-turn-helix domain-containing protein [Proteus mirabilis]|uniref:helix-turn-helix domain-containing protein n=1 Tax=Proteus TaxID=583 RepID=UPI001BD4D009|nr:helix-turn-helix transcriptional regulator [Proteus mirabilis]MDF7211069.1 helix-turn-helix domain-containing protein [Proteus mirabilis]MDF7394688.1 helix-turn-helix domain-containing protein [Proteus mirabilis]